MIQISNNDSPETAIRIKISDKMMLKAKYVTFVLMTIQITLCTGQVKEKTISDIKENEVTFQPIVLHQNTTFPQIHTNLNGMVREFVRTMYQDKKGNYWFGTNGDGIIRYDGQLLEKITIAGISPHFRVLEIVEDKAGNLWFGTSEGLLKYDGKEFTTFSKEEGVQKEEIWGVTIDKKGLVWVGSTGGIRYFNGEEFISFSLPISRVENANPMLSDKLVFKIVEDRNENMWFVTDGNGIFKFQKEEFIHLTADNNLTDNHVADILEDKKGNIWIGTFYGGVSKFDGETYTNFTKDGTIAGVEAYNFYEDSQGNIWFTAEGYGVYRYDGIHFNQFTTENGLTSNVVQSIFEDNKGQLWFGTWQGMCIFDGEKFVNAKDKEPWVN